MKHFSRRLLLSLLVLGVVTTACGPQQGAAPTLIGTALPTFVTSTLPNGPDAGTVIEATPTIDLSTTVPATPVVSSPVTISSPFPTVVVSPSTGTGKTPAIPVTGLDIVLVECQFCVDNIAHALLVLPDTATFEIASSAPATTNSPLDVNCATIEVNNGRQVVLCRGPENTPLSLNICVSNTCTEFPVNLLGCPLAQTGESALNTTQSTSGVNVTSTP